MTTETITPLTLSVDGDRAQLTFGPFVLELMPEGRNYYVAAHLASDLAAHTPGQDWPVPIKEFELVAPVATIGPGGRVS
jgi:hypothetical protein